MNEIQIFQLICWLWIGIALITAIYLLQKTAPYGRHGRPGWGLVINPRVGWILMELPAPLLVTVFFILGNDFSHVKIIFLSMWLLHYIYRTFIFPFRMRLGAGMPLIIASSGFFFNLVNGYLQGRYLFFLSSPYPDNWLWSPVFIIGSFIFLAGLLVNVISDHILRNLRKNGEKGYRIPQGWLYKWISCPNYFGEIIEWAGWAVATRSLPGLVFLVWTAANLVPRALKHHEWYRNNFTDYPSSRKAIIPFVL